MKHSRIKSRILQLMVWLVVASLAAPYMALSQAASAARAGAPILKPDEAITAALAGIEVGPDDFRISYTGGDTQFDAFTPSVAYNPITNEYLVVWAGDDTTDGEQEIFGQRIDAASGEEVGENDFRISDMGPDGNPTHSASIPRVAYNSVENEYLVVWYGDDSVDNETEIYGQRLAADGTEIGVNDFRISDMGPNGDINFDARDPSLAYNSTDNEYLVVWQGDDVVNDENDIYGQRLSAQGAEVGTNDFRISDMGPNGDLDYQAYNPNVVYNSVDNQYLVVWWGEDNTAPLVNNEFEIFGQLLTAAGAETGNNDFRISEVGANGDTSIGAFNPAAAYNPTDNQYLVVWHGEDPTPAEYEVYGQLLEANGAQIGSNDFRISVMGPDGNTGYAGYNPSATYNPAANEYLVVWSGNKLTFEYEVYGQRLTAGGAETGPDDFRLSDMGPEGDVSYITYWAMAAYNPNANQYLVVWQGDDEGLTLADDEYEIFGQLVDANGTETGENDFRISNLGGDTEYGAFYPKTAYNSIANEFLVVWVGQVWLTREFEIFGQRVDASTGELIGENFRISDMGPDGNTLPFASDSDVVFNPINNEYLVVWDGSDTILHEMEIYGQRLSPAGAELGANDFRISVSGVDGVATIDAMRPSVAHNPIDNEYLVVWESDHSLDNEFEIYGQRLDASGAEIGVDDARLTHMGPNGNTSYDARQAKVTHNPTDNQYLLVWSANDTLPTEFEIYGRLLNNSATPLGMNHFRLSSMGPDGDAAFNAISPHAAYNPFSSEYLVVWYGDDALNNKFEIYGQRLSAAGVEIGTDDFAISATGPANDDMFDATDPSVTIHPASGEAIVAWQASTPAVPDELEIYAQRLGPNGELLDTVAQLSDAGPPGDTKFFVQRSHLAYNPQDDLTLVVWTGTDDRIPMIYVEDEIFGQMFAIRVDLGLSNTDAPDFVDPGAEATYTLTTANSGPDIAAGLLLIATLPAGVTYASASGPGWTCAEAAGLVTCEAGSLAPGNAMELTLAVIAPDVEGPFSIPVTVTSGNTDLEPGNNSLTLSSQAGDPAYPVYLPITLRP